MPPAIFCSGTYARRLRNDGCLRVRLTDRKHVPAERARIQAAALSLGRRAYTSYRYPFLYARIGERVDGDALTGGPKAFGTLDTQRFDCHRGAAFS